MNKILILGNPGSGKSTLAVKLGEILGYPVIHLDKLHWQPGWVMPDDEYWESLQPEIVNGETWIIDGNYNRTLEMRLPYADAILYHNYSTALSLWRIIKRLVLNYGRNRPDMGDGCPEKFDVTFIKFTLRFNHRHKIEIEEKIKKYFKGSTFVEFKKPSDVRRYLENLKATQG